MKSGVDDFFLYFKFLQVARIILYNSINQVEVKSEVEVDWRREWISALYLSVRVILIKLHYH